MQRGCEMPNAITIGVQGLMNMAWACATAGEEALLLDFVDPILVLDMIAGWIGRWCVWTLADGACFPGCFSEGYSQLRRVL